MAAKPPAAQTNAPAKHKGTRQDAEEHGSNQVFRITAQHVICRSIHEYAPSSCSEWPAKVEDVHLSARKKFSQRLVALIQRYGCSFAGAGTRTA